MSLFEAFLNEIRILMSSGSPKGFFKPPKSTSSSNENEESKDTSSSRPPPASSSKSSSSPESKPPPDWNFGMFGPQHGPKSGGNKGSGQGRPIGEQNPDQNKMILYGALAFVAFVGAMTMFELGYKEISWKDFINKYCF